MNVKEIVLLFICIVLVVLYFTDPKEDYIEVDGKKRRVLWYTNIKGKRNWILL